MHQRAGEGERLDSGQQNKNDLTTVPVVATSGAWRRYESIERSELIICAGNPLVGVEGGRGWGEGGGIGESRPGHLDFKAARIIGVKDACELARALPGRMRGPDQQ